MKILRTMMMLALVVGILMMGSSAHAALKLRLSDGINPIVIVEDQDFVPVAPNTNIDSNPTLGAVTYIGGIGNWVVNVTTAVSKPLIGTPGSSAFLDLNSINVSSSGAGTLTIEATDNGYFIISPSPTYTLKTDIGGTTAGTLLLDKYYDVNNAEFGKTLLVHSLGPFAPVAFSGSASDPVPASPLFSVTDVITITHTGVGTTSFDAMNTVTVPEPGTLMLLGSGLLGIAGYARVKFGRKKKEA